MAGAGDERGVEVHGVGAGGVISPASEGVALAGGGEGLAGDALGVGHALERVVAVEEDTAVGDVEDLDLVDGSLGLSPAGEQRGMAGTSDERGIEVHGVGAGGVVGPTGELVALTGGGEGLASDAIGVGHALLHDIAVSKDAAVGDIDNAGLLGGGIDLARIEVSVGVVGQGGNSRAAEGQGASQARSRHRATNVELWHTTTLSLAADL